MDVPAQYSLVKSLSLPLYQSRNWLKFLGVLMVLYGVLMALTIVGVVVAWLPVWLGVLLFKTASSAEVAYLSDNEFFLRAAIVRLQSYFTIMGVLALIGLVLVLLGLFFGVGDMFFGGDGHMGRGW